MTTCYHCLDFQANETGNSTAMELEGAKRSFTFLLSKVKISKFISDRHRGIAKWIRESHAKIEHFFDIWHIAKAITKKMVKAAKGKGCEKISEWIKGIRNHIYWCATSTNEGFQQLILAKWQSYTRHISNKHSKHANKLFMKCVHKKQIKKRKWLTPGK